RRRCRSRETRAARIAPSAAATDPARPSAPPPSARGTRPARPRAEAAGPPRRRTGSCDGSREDHPLKRTRAAPGDSPRAQVCGELQPSGQARGALQAPLDGGVGVLPPEPPGPRLHLAVIVNEVLLQIDPRDGPQVGPLDTPERPAACQRPE